MNKILYTILLLSLSIIAKAQFVPIFSQYVNNGLIINPAYTGSREVLSLNLMYRNQWAGYDGAPVYQTLSAHAPLKGAKVGVGLLVFDEKVGTYHNTQAFANYAYRIPLGSGKLSFGLRAGVMIRNSNWQDILLKDPSDKAFAKDNEFFALPNLGAGVYFYNKRFFLGASIPYLLGIKENTIYHDFKDYNYLITSGVLIDFSSAFKLKPTVLLKYNSIFKQQVDLNMNIILLNNRLWLGGAYRLNEAYNSTVEVQINPQFKVGYSFDYGKIPNAPNYNSHEVSLRYEFSYKIKAANPRYF
jgi:type IX secretion system PorP/SprF family membrane protein